MAESSGVSGIEGNFTSIGTPVCVCLSENEKINATNKRDITAIPEFTNPIFLALLPRDFFRGVEKSLEDLRRFIFDTI